MFASATQGGHKQRLFMPDTILLHLQLTVLFYWSMLIWWLCFCWNDHS